MLTIDPALSTLLLIDFQARLMPAIHQGADVVANAQRLLAAAVAIGIPRLFTEQNPEGLGPTVFDLDTDASDLAHKMTFDACRTPGFLARIATGRDVVVAGCEAHVCVLQTVLGLIDSGRKVFVVRDALGARRAENKDAALRRMERHGAEIVTTEMVVFEWFQTSEHPQFRETVALIK